MHPSVICTFPDISVGRRKLMPVVPQEKLWKSRLALVVNGLSARPPYRFAYTAFRSTQDRCTLVRTPSYRAASTGLPSLTISMRSIGGFSTCCTRPSGQWISSRSALVNEPSPKCTRKSELDA